MTSFKEPSLAERQSAAARARKAALEKFRARPGPDDPDVVGRQADRMARAAERTAAKQAREVEKAQQLAREAELAEKAAKREAERAEQAAKAAAETAARERAERAAREKALEAERKAARDERYAARKKRKR